MKTRFNQSHSFSRWPKRRGSRRIWTILLLSGLILVLKRELQLFPTPADFNRGKVPAHILPLPRREASEDTFDDTSLVSPIFGQDDEIIVPSLPIVAEQKVLNLVAEGEPQTVNYPDTKQQRDSTDIYTSVTSDAIGEHSADITLPETEIVQPGHHSGRSENDQPREDENVQWRLATVRPMLDDQTQKEPRITLANDILKSGVAEHESELHLSLERTGDSLPDIIFIPFEEAVEDMELEGWEDKWIAHGIFDRGGLKLDEPEIDFVYLWVNGSEQAFIDNKRPYEVNSVLNDVDGKWLQSHGVNRYRDWGELKYSIRSIEKHAGSFRNYIQILVNSVPGTENGKQVPTWLNGNATTNEVIKVLSQEEFFDEEKHTCLPTFNSLTIENQIFNTPSTTDYMFAMSDDMFLGKPHAASDIVSSLYGPVMGFKTNSYNTQNPPTEADAKRFGEKPYLIYSSWLLNRRFGNRKRKGQGHFGHALSRKVMKEAISSFPGPELQSACKRFRGEPGFQLYSWYIAFHYLIERHREAMIWSYIMLRSDRDKDGYMDWAERQKIIQELTDGIKNEGKSSFRKRNFFHASHTMEEAGLQPPIVNTDMLWTSQDGPWPIMGLECTEFDVNECLAPGFSTASSASANSPVFSTSLIFDRLARQNPECGDCLIKLLLNQVQSGLEPILPDRLTHGVERDIVVKSLMRYRYSINEPDAQFVMVKDAEQVDSTLTAKYVRGTRKLPGQVCLNDDVDTTNEHELEDVKVAMTELYQGLFPERSIFE